METDGQPHHRHGDGRSTPSSPWRRTVNPIIAIETDGQPCRLDAIWRDVLSQKTATGDDRFACLGKVMVPLLSLPHSNANCERTFSMVRKVHTEARKSLYADTITVFLQCKINFAVTPAILYGADLYPGVQHGASYT